MKSRDLLLVVIALGMGASGMWLWKRPAQKSSKADMAGLSSELSAAAERLLPTPSLEMPDLPTPIPDSRSAEAPTDAPSPPWPK